MTLPFASDELHRSFFHEVPDVPWSEFHAELRSADVVRRRTHIPLISSALRSCNDIDLRNLSLKVHVTDEDIFEWIGQHSATSHQRRVVTLDYDSIAFRSPEDGLVSHLRGMREAFPQETVANPCYIEFRGVPQSVLDRKSELEHRKCNRRTMEYFEILVVYPDLIVRRRPLF
ncbi:hypothetical protein AAVH_19855 [Aphelenchoides avenae]|nr:hypothetical protein AAVH_19855 [Aphelenchus avenae]